MPGQLLLDEAIYPSDDILCAALNGTYPAFQAFRELLTNAQVTMEWRYYKDSKSWLCR